MTDENAVKLANLLAEYARESKKEGATYVEVAEWTIGETIKDLVDTTPDYLFGKLDSLAVVFNEPDQQIRVNLFHNF